MKKPNALAMLFLAGLMAACACTPPAKYAQQLWNVDSLNAIAGNQLTLMGDPKLVDAPWGLATAFDGDGDRLLVKTNPLGNALAFTVEMLVKPRDVYPHNIEPRIFHIEAPDNPNRRLTIEMRLNDKHQWYLDTYIKAEGEQRVLIDPQLVHPINQWAHIAVVYAQGEFTSYVNGQRELSGAVNYLPVGEGAYTSIGARMNQVHWFAGEIALVATTRKALVPDEFALLAKLPQKLSK